MTIFENNRRRYFSSISSNFFDAELRLDELLSFFDEEEEECDFDEVDLFFASKAFFLSSILFKRKISLSSAIILFKISCLSPSNWVNWGLGLRTYAKTVSNVILKRKKNKAYTTKKHFITKRLLKKFDREYFFVSNAVSISPTYHHAYKIRAVPSRRSLASSTAASRYNFLLQNKKHRHYGANPPPPPQRAYQIVSG